MYDEDQLLPVSALQHLLFCERQAAMRLHELIEAGRAELKHQLLEAYNPEKDSLRFYYLGSNWRRRVEHHGTKATVDLEGPLIA